MATFVLIHGAWHGGWCWRRVAGRLRAAGHEVYTPTLTGLGERAHLARADLTLSDHITDVVAVLEMEELQDVQLVGHSYGGAVITGVAERAADRISRLVYLDAFVVEDGKAVLDYTGPSFADVLQEAVGRGPGSAERPIPAPDFYGVSEPDDVAWLNRHLVPHPMKTAEEKIRLPGNKAAALSRTFIYCDEPAMGPFDQFAERLGDDPDWSYHVLHTGHDAMVSDPEGVTAILLRDAAL